MAQRGGSGTQMGALSNPVSVRTVCSAAVCTDGKGTRHLFAMACVQSALELLAALIKTFKTKKPCD